MQFKDRGKKNVKAKKYRMIGVGIVCIANGFYQKSRIIIDEERLNQKFLITTIFIMTSDDLN